MSFYDDASLVFLPSGQAGKDGKAYSMKPTDGSGDFTFSRGSNLTATRIDSNGLIAKGRENLFLNSDTPATQSITITNGGVYVLSFLGTGSVVASGGASFTLNGTGEFDRVENYFVSSSTSVTLTISGTISEPQLELGLAATEYILSGASSGKAGILEHSPRFDYGGGASCASLILEGSRTNLIEYSEYFEGSGWTAQAGITLTANTTETLSPEGLNNAYKVVSTDATKGFYFSGLSITNAAVRTIYLKGSVGGETIVFKDPSGFGTPSTKTLTTDWQRFEMATTNDGNTYQGLFIDDISVGTIYAYGAQLEEGSYPTSYIPNHSGGSVTRDADVNTLLNQSGVIGQTAGTILFDAYFDEAEKVNFSISDSSVSNFISIETTSSNEVTAKVEQGGSTQATITTTTSFFAEGDRLKCAIAYDDRDMAFYINGTQVNTAAPNLIPACDDVRFGNYDGSIKADQRVNRVLLFDTRISNGNLATLTS